MPTLTELMDDAALLSFEHQLHLADVLGQHSWRVDMAAQEFTFTGTTPRTCTRFHLLGSAAPRPQTWLWGWANPTGYAESLLGLSGYVRDFGAKHDIGELTEPEIAFGDLPGSPTDPFDVAGLFVDAAKAVANKWTSYTGELAGGTRAAFLVEHPDFVLPAPEPARVMSVLRDSLTDVVLTDHRRAFGSYAARRGLGPVFAPDASRLSMTGPGLAATVHFGPDGKVADITTTMGAGTP